VVVAGAYSQERPTFRIKVEVMTFSFTLKDSKGRAIRGLLPSAVTLTEDGIPQVANLFADGRDTAYRLINESHLYERINGASDIASVGSVSFFFVVDTSDQMYRDLSRLSDVVSRFVGMVEVGDSVAVYLAHRNLTRMCPLTKDRQQAVAAARRASAGGRSALFDCIMLTVKEAARISGRRAVIVLTNGMDTESMVASSDVAAVASDQGVPLFIFSTKVGANLKAFGKEVLDSGGAMFTEPSWKAHRRSFQAILDDFNTGYCIFYYPQANPNEGFRKFELRINNDMGKQFRLRYRPGYRPRDP
jgi:VWFA-related protein